MQLVVQVDVDGTSVLLDDPNDHGRLDVRVVGTADHALVGVALTDAGVGWLVDGQQAFLRPASLCSLAGPVDAVWRASFDAMVSYARAHGWVDDESGDLAAHVLWPERTAP